jgi:hypothetical protein
VDRVEPALEGVPLRGAVGDVILAHDVDDRDAGPADRLDLLDVGVLGELLLHFLRHHGPRASLTRPVGAVFCHENTGGTLMAVRKIAISIPEDVVTAVDRAAARRRTTRSAYIADVLRRVARARSDAEITQRINAVLDDDAVAREQQDTAAAFNARRPREGWKW